MGWARANVLYDRTPKVPTPGTPLESLILIVWRMRQDIEVQKNRAIITAIVAAASDGDNRDKVLQESWKAYLDESFPFKQQVIHLQDDKAVEFLKREVARGPLTVTPLQTLGGASSKLRKRKEKSESKRNK